MLSWMVNLMAMGHKISLDDEFKFAGDIFDIACSAFSRVC